MKNLFFLLIIAGFMCCRHKHADETSKYKFIYADTINVLKAGDSAVIHISYPQGTAWYHYSFEEGKGIVKLTDHKTHEGDPDEAGGPMSETFYLKALKPGIDTIKIVDRSPDALNAASDTTRTFINYKKYIIKIE